MPLTQVSSRLIEDTLRYVLGSIGSVAYTFTGKGLNGTVSDPTLTLSRGHTYVFENRNANGAHPFYIKTSLANGGTNDAYNTGVTNNGGAGGTEIVFTVPHDAPDTLYYQCSSHSSMNGQLNIAGSVADGSITESKLADDAVTEDKLANSINSAIAANTAKDLTALSASNLTSGTVPDARFPATLPAASAANLTSIPAANLTGALPAISGAALTGLSAGAFSSFAVIGDQKGTNTSGGSSTSGAFYARDLNTIFTDPDTIVSISSNQFTLQAGTYLLHANAPAYKAARHQILIYNVTDSTVVAVGTSEYTATNVSVQTRSFATNKITITSAKAFEVRHRVGSSLSTYGLGVETNYDTLASIYTIVEIYKE